MRPSGYRLDAADDVTEADRQGTAAGSHSRLVPQFGQFMVTDKANAVSPLHLLCPLVNVCSARGPYRSNHWSEAIFDFFGHQSFVTAFDLVAAVPHQFNRKQLCVLQKSQVDQLPEPFSHVRVSLPIDIEVVVDLTLIKIGRAIDR